MMPKAFLVIVLVLASCSSALAESKRQESIQISPIAPVCYQSPQDDNAPSLLAGRGCCSHHKGQCGCEGGRVVCCDGTLSPSCRCEKDEGPVN